MTGKLKSYIKWILRGEIPTEVLVKRGLKLGNNFNRQRGCTIDPPHCGLISIGDNVTLAPNVHILAHDASTKYVMNYTKIGRVNIGSNVFIGAESVVLPNVNIGDNCIVGAGSVVTKDVEAGHVVAGNPAKVIMTIQEYKSKNEELMKSSMLYDNSYTLFGNITEDKKEEMISLLENNVAYVE